MNSSNSESSRIIVVDDNERIHADFRKILETTNTDSNTTDMEDALFGPSEGSKAKSKPTYELDVASQGQEGFKRIMEARRDGRPFSIAFVDVRMPPGWDGVETTKRILCSDPAIQIVICTAFSDYATEDMLEHFGFSDRVSALLIHLSGGRIETHFHIFGSLAFLAFYRDCRRVGIVSGVA